MTKILILYFSGAGATKKLSEEMYHYISPNSDADMYSIEESNKFNISNYQALIIGTPVYHAAPSRLVTGYFNRMEPLARPIPAFIFNTRALWSCNTNRILARQLQSKNIITIMDKEYRSPASDGVLIAPYIKRFFGFEKKLPDKIRSDCAFFIRYLQSGAKKGYIPGFRLSSVINAPNKLVGQLTTFTIYLHKNACVKCHKCIENCPHQALYQSASGYPVFIKKNCENCYRCIHHCPSKALSLSKRKAPKQLLYRNNPDSTH